MIRGTRESELPQGKIWLSLQRCIPVRAICFLWPTILSMLCAISKVTPGLVPQPIHNTTLLKSAYSQWTPIIPSAYSQRTQLYLQSKEVVHPGKIGSQWSIQTERCLEPYKGCLQEVLRSRQGQRSNHMDIRSRMSQRDFCSRNLWPLSRNQHLEYQQEDGVGFQWDLFWANSLDNVIYE